MEVIYHTSHDFSQNMGMQVRAKSGLELEMWMQRKWMRRGLGGFSIQNAEEGAIDTCHCLRFNCLVPSA